MLKKFIVAPKKFSNVKNMINETTLLNLKTWFEKYVKGFHSKKAEVNKNINIKIGHTKRVCIEISAIANSLDLCREEFYLAEVVALLHDIGRFEQYAKYGTFKDGISEDHAALGVRIINENGILNWINKTTQSLILRIVSYHNRATLPVKETDKCLLFLKMLRDADKIDIWHVVTNYYYRSNKKRNNSIELDLPDIPEFSKNILEDIIAGRIAGTDDMKTLNDFKALQMSWIFDINFPYSFKIIQERKYLEKIRDTITDKSRADAIYAIAKAYLEKYLYLLLV